MKRNKILRTAAILLALVLISTIAMTGTLAKYVATLDGASATVRAGLFKVTVEPGEETEALLTFAGAAIVNDSVLAYDDDAIIVPGTQFRAGGAFEIVNDSEVAVLVDVVPAATTWEALIDLQVGFEDIPLEFSFDEGVSWDTVADLVLALAGGNPSDLFAGANLSVVIPPQDSAPLAINVWVKWAYSVDAAQDIADTAVGLAQAGWDGTDFDADFALELNTLSVPFNITATQVEPA